MSGDLKNILVVKLSAIGDVIHALPVSYAIKESFPAAKLTWIVEPPAYDLLRLNPCIDRIIIFHKKEFRSFGGFVRRFFPFRREIQQESYDAVLDLQGLFKSAAIAFFAKSNIKLGICNMRELSDKVSRPVIGANAGGHIVERYLDTARAIGCRVEKVVFPLEIPDAEIKKAAALMEQAGLRAGNSHAVFVIGANWPNKRWPTENFARLSDWFYGRNIVPVLVGNGAVDTARAEEIEARAEIPPVNLINETTLPQLAHVIKTARFALGGDTGPVHLAAGLKIPTVMIMGPTDANRNGPYGQIENALEVDRPCKACWKRACPKGLDCLENISAAAVEEKFAAMIQASR